MKFLMLLLAVAAFGQIEAPRIGYWRDAQNRLRPLHGMAANLIPGPVVREGVLAFAWFGDGGWLRTETEVERLDASGATVARLPAAEARFNATTVWFPELGTSYAWDGKTLKNEPIDETKFAAVEEGEPLGEGWLHVREEGHSYAVRRGVRYEIPEAEDETH